MEKVMTRFENNKKWRETGLDLLGDFAGALLQAIGVWCFIEPSRIAPGGVSGIALMINHLFGLTDSSPSPHSPTRYSRRSSHG